MSEPLQFEKGKQVCRNCDIENPDFEHLDVHGRNPWLSKEDVEIRASGIRKATALFSNAEARGRIKKR
jgi:hypothetical protein